MQIIVVTAIGIARRNGVINFKRLRGNFLSFYGCSRNYRKVSKLKVGPASKAGKNKL